MFKFVKTKLKKTILTIGIIMIALLTAIILFTSPIAKYLIEKYSVKYTGRQIKTGWVYVNPFTGFIHLGNLKIYEANSDSIFISARGLSVGVALRKLFSKEYEITSITLDKPVGIAIQNSRRSFNFTDIIEHFSGSATDTIKTENPPLHFSMLNMKIKDGTFYLRDTLAHVNYFIKDFNYESTGWRWNADTLPGTFSFSNGMGTGHLNGNFSINTSNSDYYFSFAIQKLNLSILGQYLKDMINYGNFSAFLDANIKAKGNFKDGENIDAKGRVSINNFHLGKTKWEDYFAFDTLILAVNEINPKMRFYHLDSVTIDHPYFKYEQYDYLDNIETMFGKSGNKVAAESNDHTRFNLILSLSKFFATISKEFFESQYKANRLAIRRADLKFNDYSVSEKFSIDADPLTIVADSINKDKGNVNVSVTTGIQPYGNAFAYISIDPKNDENFDLNYHITNVPVTLLNPYIISYTSFPLDRGTIELNGEWNVRNSIIQSENHLMFIDPRVTKRLRNKDDKWLPTPLIMAFLRGRSNVIDYQIPVTGNLKKTKFHLRDIFLSILTNIFVKPPTTPYRIEVRNQEEEIEKSVSIKWQMRNCSMTHLQELFMNKLAKFLSENPTASIFVTPEQYTVKEKEYILFYEAKKKYYLSLHPGKLLAFNKSDSLYVNRMSIKDSSFIRYLNEHLNRKLLFTVQDKCNNLVDPSVVDSKLTLLNTTRRNIFLSYFKDKGSVERVKFRSVKTIIPYNGFSYYKIDYNGELPDYLVKAYEKMEELNNEAPRKKYEKERGKLKVINP